MAQCRILVVDDDQDTRESLRTLLELNGHTVEEAADGETALKLAAATDPEIVFLDIGLPQIDGCVLARRIRATDAGRRCRLIALTGYGMAEDRARTQAAGFAVHLVKPVEPDELLGAMRQTR